jgi:hypothetical protein
LDILTHPLVEPPYKQTTLVNLINKNNYTFITHHKLMELNPKLIYFLLLFQKWEKVRLRFRDRFKLLLTIKDSLSNDNEEEKSQKPLFFHFKVINKLINYYSQHEHIKIETLYIYKQVIDLAEVLF